MNLEEKKLLTCKETAQYLGISEAALRKRIFLGQVKNLITRLGGRVYFSKVKLDRFLENGAEK